VVVGGGQVGRLIARRLAGGGRVRFVDEDEAAVDRAATRHEATYLADLRDRRSLAAALDGATHAVVATGRDATNLLVTQHCRTLGVPVVVAVVADPRTHDAYPPDVVRVCAAAAVVEDVVAAVPAHPPPEEA
jgi:Trk K+ transport system NAD-binding subunit